MRFSLRYALLALPAAAGVVAACALPGATKVDGSGANGTGANNTSTSGTGGSGGTAGVPGRMPDSFTTTCTDGSLVSPCPVPGDPGYGQDGCFHIHVPDYVAADGVLRDSVTGLVWQPDLTGDAVNLVQAEAACTGSTLGNHGDWRVPTRRELVTLFNHGLYNPAIAPMFTAGGLCLTSTLAVNGNPWIVGIAVGETYVSASGTVYNVRCVRGPALPDPVFTINGDAVVDSSTGLAWDRTTFVAEKTWLEALALCSVIQNGGDAGPSGFRLPNAKELLTLVAADREMPAIDTQAFPDTRNDTYWSSTPNPDYPDRAYAVNFATGETLRPETIVPHWVRCVRDAN